VTVVVTTALCLGAVALTPASSATDWGSASVSGFAPRPGGGWYTTYPNGKVTTGGGATHYGDMAGKPLNLPVTGIASTPTGRGYWLVASDGGIFSFGDARFYGSTGNLRLNQPIVGMAPTPTGRGYWMVATDGGIFSFGDARFYGSTGNLRLNRPINGMASTPTGRGYWLVASDGGIFTFGDARFYGSTGARHLPAPIVGLARGPRGEGYWLVGADGSVYAFGSAQFYGAPVGRTFGTVTGITRRVGKAGYVVVDTGGHHVYGPDTGTEGIHKRAGSSGGSAPYSVLDGIAADIMRRLNDERAARGIRTLAISASLSADAKALADRMAANGQLTHLVDFSTLMPKHNASAGGENIAYTNAKDSPASAHTMWMNSDPHRQNMLNRGFNTLGVGASCRGGVVYVSMLLLRVDDWTPLDRTVPPRQPFVRSDVDPNSSLHC
jgi:hypothetical protein